MIFRIENDDFKLFHISSDFVNLGTPLRQLHIGGIWRWSGRGWGKWLLLLFTNWETDCRQQPGIDCANKGEWIMIQCSGLRCKSEYQPLSTPLQLEINIVCWRIAHVFCWVEINWGRSSYTDYSPASRNIKFQLNKLWKYSSTYCQGLDVFFSK